MYLDGYKDLEKLAMVAEMQSYTGDKPKDNRYIALDEFHCANIQGGQRLYAFQSDYYKDKLCCEKPEPVGIKWFFDQATYDRLIKDGNFSSKELSEHLQLDYWRDPQSFDEGGVYRDTIYAFDLLEEIRVPVGVCLANDQFGNGEGHQCFIPEDMVIQLQKDGLLVFNQEASLINKGTDKYVSKSRCDEIDLSIYEKRTFCKDNNQKHCTISSYAIPAIINEPIVASPFDCSYYGIYSTYDYLKDEKIDPSLPITGERAGEHFVKKDDLSSVEALPKKESQNSESSINTSYSNDIQQSLKGLNNLQKFLNHDNAEYLGDMHLQNEPYYI